MLIYINFIKCLLIELFKRKHVSVAFDILITLLKSLALTGHHRPLCQKVNFQSRCLLNLELLLPAKALIYSKLIRDASKAFSTSMHSIVLSFHHVFQHSHLLITSQSLLNNQHLFLSKLFQNQ